MNDQERLLPHLTEAGAVHMIAVSGKPPTVRRASADGWLTTRPDVVAALKAGTVAKGDALAVARVAAIQAAKRTAEWIPLAHPVALTGVTVDIELGEDRVHVVVGVEATGPTGVELEALTGVSAALLSLYDMLKKADRGMTLGPIMLREKSGGRSGRFRRGETP